MKAVDRKHILSMKSGAIIANSGHFNVEIDIEALEDLAEQKYMARPSVDEYIMKDGKRICLLGEGRLINLAAAEGHPSSVMDMSFANQALSAEHIANEGNSLENAVFPVPKVIDEEVGRLKLQSMGIAIDALTNEQQQYLGSWQIGT